MIVIGDVIEDIDVWLRTVRQSPEGAWPVAVEERRESRHGGAGAVAAMVRGLGEEATLLGDVKQRCVKQRFFLDREQVLRLDKDDCTPISESGAGDIVKKIPRGAIVLVADYGKGVITPMLWRMLTCKCRVIVDPSRQRSRAFYRGAWGYLPNRNEANVPCVRSAIQACDILTRDFLFPHTCIKLDRDGMVADGVHIPASCPPSEVVDVCGAGDMVLAAIGVAIARGESWLNACRFANEMAGLKVRQHGATPLQLVCNQA